jgi:plastocyanin
MSRVQTAATLTVLLAAALALLLYTHLARAADQAVSVTNFQFSPGSVTIDVGDSVTFSFDGGTHGVEWTGGPPAADSGIRNSGTFVFTPSQAGTYIYICVVHGVDMAGSVTVNAQQQATNTPTNTTVPPTATPSNTPTATPTPANDDSPPPTPAGGGTATRTPTSGPGASVTSEPTAAATATPESADTPGSGDATSTTTPIETATLTATAVSDDGETPAGTPGAPDTAGDDDDGGSPWGILIIVAVLAIAAIGLVIGILSLRNRPTAA